MTYSFPCDLTKDVTGTARLYRTAPLERRVERGLNKTHETPHREKVGAGDTAAGRNAAA
ncbi:MAG: hypothetical protein WA142_06885 [Rugosibacter sp.]